jgi:hypothetical protein
MSPLDIRRHGDRVAGLHHPVNPLVIGRLVDGVGTSVGRQLGDDRLISAMSLSGSGGRQSVSSVLHEIPESKKSLKIEVGAKEADFIAFSRTITESDPRGLGEKNFSRRPMSVTCLNTIMGEPWIGSLRPSLGTNRNTSSPSRSYCRRKIERSSSSMPCQGGYLGFDLRTSLVKVLGAEADTDRFAWAPSSPSARGRPFILFNDRATSFMRRHGLAFLADPDVRWALLR